MAIIMIRLDKYLANMGVGTRSEVKNYIRKGQVSVNGISVKTPEHKVSDADLICHLNQKIQYERFLYYMLNKPQGVVSATEDRKFKTVLDLLDGVTKKDLFPVGRLDKDTEGLLLITNDGKLAHELLSPKKHVDKTYIAKIQGVVTKEDQAKFLEGLDIGEKRVTLPANLEILSSAEISEIKVVIKEGKFHQIKRMFQAVGKEVIYLKRIAMGSLILDEKLLLGEFRTLTEKEINELCLQTKKQ